MKVYFVEVGKDRSMVKIGASFNPVRRAKQLAYQFGEPVTLVAVMDGGLEQELALHNKFASDLVFLQGELFHKSQELTDIIAKHECEECHFNPPADMRSKIVKRVPWDGEAAAKALADGTLKLPQTDKTE